MPKLRSSLNQHDNQQSTPLIVLHWTMQHQHYEAAMPIAAGPSHVRGTPPRKREPTTPRTTPTAIAAAGQGILPGNGAPHRGRDRTRPDIGSARRAAGALRRILTDEGAPRQQEPSQPPTHPGTSAPALPVIANAGAQQHGTMIRPTWLLIPAHPAPHVNMQQARGQQYEQPQAAPISSALQHSRTPGTLATDVVRSEVVHPMYSENVPGTAIAQQPPSGTPGQSHEQVSMPPNLTTASHHNFVSSPPSVSRSIGSSMRQTRNTSPLWDLARTPPSHTTGAPTLPQLVKRRATLSPLWSPAHTSPVPATIRPAHPPPSHPPPPTGGGWVPKPADRVFERDAGVPPTS